MRTKKRGVTSKRGEIVLAPFRFTDRDVYRIRPVLVVSHPEQFASTGQIIAAMITAAERSNWPLDISIDLWREAGLTFPSFVRMKLFTIDNGQVRDRIGHLDDKAVDQVGINLATLLT